MGKKFFTIKREENGYYVVYLKRSVFVYLVSKEKAEKVVDLVSPLYNWRRVRSINHLFRKDREAYERVAVHLRKYASPRRFNGNYQSTLLDGLVTYRLRNKSIAVTGKEYGYGIAIRESEGIYFVDLILAGISVAYLNNKSEAESFIEEFVKYVPVNHPDAGEIVKDSNTVIKFSEILKRNITSGEKRLPGDLIKELYELQFAFLNNEDETKKDYFVRASLGLKNMIGLESVKKQMEIFAKTLSAEKRLKNFNINTKKTPYHSLLVGPPGTGKTVFARIFAEYLWSLGLIKENKLLEISKEDLTSQYVGGTEEIVEDKVFEALGGVLFVDEAYTLANSSGNDQTGKIALEIIMRAMENHRDDIVVIFAGYEDEIKKLLEVNQGLRSRFVHTFRFEDYSKDELVEISFGMLESQGFRTYNLEDEMGKLITTHMDNGVLPGNARAVRNLVDRIIENHKLDLAEGKGHYINISPDAIKRIYSQKQSKKEGNQVESATEELNKLIGLRDLKKQIETWSNYVLIERKRFERGMSGERPTLHMSFEGNPGTGKTTVARIVGKILRHNGLLSRGQFKEVSRSDLVGEYVGHTAIKVKKLIESSIGGILFIDEAYSLVQGENDTFGNEAVDTLIAEMENNRDDLVVILAGYTNEIDQLLESNPGFKSRVSTRFQFPDYSSEELFELFLLQITSQQFVLCEETKKVAKEFIFTEKKKGNVDGNGRWVRNLVDRIKMNQANRLVSEGSDELEVIKPQDIIVPS